MKKISKPRLTLRRETVTILTVTHLQRLVGGLDSQSLSTGPSYAGCASYSCDRCAC